ncbi:EF-P lysine aminoacylase EpmA [Desulforhopalus singaporensis]|uniref:Lysyl-tRNA synthetase, class 2 n=1 Tax=Desulforhopalus singaporensis TaxID=91360 RepID=A0A1H0JPG8_9BACT|nr:EF-P lysine aminoacylase EpmA [Desulforhopalus singaporensis]SDO45464.1 lysyl-tRNA synthetase, class 2 [Desulforhopalus singaporensis]
MLGEKRLKLRAAFFDSVRLFFKNKGFLEVDTPVRQPVVIPEANIVPIEADGEYLQASPELCMKRLLARGLTNIFQICPCFRKNEIGTLHMEEFRMLEWYRRGARYHALMDDCEQLLRAVDKDLTATGIGCGPGGDNFFAETDLDMPFLRITVAQAFDAYSRVPLEQAVREGSFDEVLVEDVEPKLGGGRPVFLYDYPVELGSLARRKDEEPHLVERFELYINGIELANGFTELTDEREQRTRFHDEIEAIKQGRNVTTALPERFLQDLEHLDSAAGIALGLDRLLMVAVNGRGLKEVVPFTPQDLT